jgi:hypothetical protein
MSKKLTTWSRDIAKAIVTEVIKKLGNLSGKQKSMKIVSEIDSELYDITSPEVWMFQKKNKDKNLSNRFAIE